MLWLKAFLLTVVGISIVGGFIAVLGWMIVNHPLILLAVFLSLGFLAMTKIVKDELEKEQTGS